VVAPRITLLSIPVIGLAGVLSASPQETAEPSRLVELRAKYAKEVAAATAARLEKYRDALVRLEHSLADQRQYRAAIPVRDERLKIEKTLGQTAGRAPGAEPALPYPGGPITLVSKNAKVLGGVTYDEKKDALDGWKSKGASARWMLPFPLKAGGYEVVLEMACAPGSGGQVTIKEDFHSLTKMVKPTKSWQDFASQSLGTLRVKANSTGLNLNALTVEGDGLFLLRAVKLLPVAASIQ
jgi:hypothetical protein